MKTIPTDDDHEFEGVKVTCFPEPAETGFIEVSLLPVTDSGFRQQDVLLSPGGAVLLAEQLLKAARKVSV